jgi:tetratricopeptide (TPR) repeat protein
MQGSRPIRGRGWSAIRSPQSSAYQRLMNPANQRSALGALDTARPLIARLDIARDPEDIAADIIDGWAAAETALRSMVGGSSLGGQALVRELRQRELLSLDQAHALLEFLAARERAQRTEYRPTSADIAAAREGFQKLEERLTREAELEFRRHSAPSVAQPAAPPAGPPPPPADYLPVPTSTSARGPGLMILTTLLVAIGLAVGAFYLLARGRPGTDSALQRGVVAYRAGQREAAKGEFTKAARDDPKAALPHIYLGRIAREEGDAAAASSELQTAVRLEPDNAVAQREMGSHLLASGNPELARRFYVRAVQLDPNDSTAQGYLACALARLGRTAEAQRFLARAGQGGWSACVSGAPPPRPAVPGALPAAPLGAPAPR